MSAVVDEMKKYADELWSEVRKANERLCAEKTDESADALIQAAEEWWHATNTLHDEVMSRLKTFQAQTSAKTFDAGHQADQQAHGGGFGGGN